MLFYILNLFYIFSTNLIKQNKEKMFIILNISIIRISLSIEPKVPDFASCSAVKFSLTRDISKVLKLAFFSFRISNKTMADLDSTQVLLESTISTPEMIDSVYQDESEDEVFFGKVSSKEMTIPSKIRR